MEDILQYGIARSEFELYEDTVLSVNSIRLD